MKKKLVLLVAAAAASVLPMTASASAAPAAGDPTKTIAEQASADPQFSTLVAALGAADLVGPFDACTDAKTTVFTTNDALAAALTALGMTADQLLADTELLTSVLTYHVVSGAVDAATVVGLTEATTLNGAKISIKVVDGTVLLNDTVKVTTTDIQACNGIIHVIDAVLLPPAAPTAPTGEMPATGAASDTLVMGAAALLLGGAGALLISRRRRPVNA